MLVSMTPSKIRKRDVLQSSFTVYDLPTRQAAAAARTLASRLPQGVRIQSVDHSQANVRVRVTHCQHFACQWLLTGLNVWANADTENTMA